MRPQEEIDFLKYKIYYKDTKKVEIYYFPSLLYYEEMYDSNKNTFMKE